MLMPGVWWMPMRQFRKRALDCCRSHELPMHFNGRNATLLNGLCRRYSSQFSIRNPEMLEKSRVLAVSKTQSRDTAIEAIFRSIEPARFFCERKWRNVDAAALSNGRMVQKLKNSISPVNSE